MNSPHSYLQCCLFVFLSRILGVILLVDAYNLVSHFRMRIKKLPQILALHLKRFKYVEQLQRFTKLSYRVVFPFELRLFNTVSYICVKSASVFFFYIISKFCFFVISSNVALYDARQSNFSAKFAIIVRRIEELLLMMVTCWSYFKIFLDF